MSDRDDSGLIHPYYHLATSLSLWAGLAYLSLHFLPSIWVFGGTSCTTTKNMLACTGYPPTGLLVLGIAAFLLPVGLIGGLQRVDRIIK